MAEREAGDAFDRELLARAVDVASDAIIVADAEGRVVYWNAGAVRIFGYTEAQALGASLDLIIPERLRERHWSAFGHAIATGASHYGADDLLAVPAVTFSGATVSIEFTIVLLELDNSVGHVAAFIRDVTERRARELGLRRRISELEASLADGPSPGEAVE
ncbi:MAG: PAS domain-containing protein [Acidimicrobiales bacterium]